jgi:hypothetical protein
MAKQRSRWRTLTRLGLVFVLAAGAVVSGGLAGQPRNADAVIRVAEFVADCPLSHRLPDDPIVFPGLPGASHSHDFFGNHATDAHSDYEELNGATGNCDPAEDISSYWVPTMYRNNNVVVPTSVTFYYLGEGVNNPGATQPTPVGLKIVAGNAKATGDADSIARWSCLHAGHVPPSKNFVNCPSGTQLETYLDFPQCWNGTSLDSADHKSHMAYPVAGGCPGSHPVSVPKLRMVIRFPVSGDPSGLRLSSGDGRTMHGDFFNVWPADEMERRVRDCIRPVVKCGHDGHPV